VIKLLGKVGVAALSLLLSAAPAMACFLPGAMTAAERECCKRMAQECGRSGMPQSHSCCQTTALPDHQPAVKMSDGSVKHFALILLQVLPPTMVLLILPGMGASSFTFDIHSPPASPPVSVSILRI
jgi:hypothetical protein